MPHALSNANRALNLHAGDAVLAIDQHPESDHPLIGTDGITAQMFSSSIFLMTPLVYGSGCTKAPSNCV